MCQRKKAEEFVCRGNYIQMFVHIILSQGDVFECLGRNSNARLDMHRCAVMCDTLT